MFLTMQVHLEVFPTSFRIITHHPLHKENGVVGHVCANYTAAWSQSPLSSLQTLIQGAKAAGHAWIHFASLVVGESGHSRAAFDLVLMSNVMPHAPSMYNTQNWRSFRSANFLAAKVPARANDTLVRQSIVILSKPAEDNRECWLTMCTCMPTDRTGTGVSPCAQSLTTPQPFRLVLTLEQPVQQSTRFKRSQ